MRCECCCSGAAIGVEVDLAAEAEAEPPPPSLSTLASFTGCCDGLAAAVQVGALIFRMLMYAPIFVMISESTCFPFSSFVRC